MEGTLHSTLSSSGKQRRRTVTKTARKFPVEDTIKKTILPTPVAISKKPRKVLLFRVFAIGTLFFILLSTFALWRKREHRRIALTDQPDSLKKLRFALPSPSEDNLDKTTSLKDPDLNDDVPEERTRLNRSDYGKTRDEARESRHGEERDIPTEKTDHMHHDGHMNSSTGAKAEDISALESENTDMKEKNHAYEMPPDRIEWYSRDDYKEGKRPMCRISRPIVLSNGTILLPSWMHADEKLLRRCGLGLHGFYSSSEPAGVQSVVDIDADFSLTIHLERFQEPTHVPSVYLTEHVLKSSYLFDTFSGGITPDEGVEENHCVATETGTKCGLPRPKKNLLKPGIFVPRRIETSSKSSWPQKFVDMFGVAHGDGNGVIHLNASSILTKSHDKQSNNLVGTRFRSILTTDGMFRHLPVGVLDHSSFFSARNGISRKKRERKNGIKCSVTVGISASKETTVGFDASSELKEKLEMLSRFASLSHIEVKEIEASSATDFEGHIKQMQDLDVFVAGSGEDMTSIGFLPSGGMVFELMPFGINPDTHRSLARALNINYNIIKGKPNEEGFKQCIESEIFNLRKKGNLPFTEAPEWQEPLMEAWENAVADFVLSGASKFNILASQEPVNNYYSRLCALKQKIEVGMDEAARQIIKGAKQKCALN